MKNKNKLLLFLALNAASSFVSAKEIGYDKLYDKITKNITTGKSNNDSYKLIERILVQRNRELKDLYAQGDYIVKPEYLEWQIFATGFYAERGNGDNTSGNARYNSKTEGYFDENGKYVSSSSGKPYKDKQEPKTIELINKIIRNPKWYIFLNSVLKVNLSLLINNFVRIGSKIVETILTTIP